MKNIKFFLWGTLVIITGLWLMADSLPADFGYFQFRFLANQYSGAVAMGAMSLCMLLAVRPKWLEPTLHGLDKGYRLHKWFGITALIASLTHFWFTKGTKWMVGWGWLERPNRPKRGVTELTDGFDLEHWLGSFRGIAEDVGEWAFYIALVLLVMALVKRIPYHWFVKLHKWLALAYLALVFHAVILIKFDYWSKPIGWLLAVLLLAGSISALISLFQKIGAKQKHIGTVSHIRSLPQSGAWEMTIDTPSWQRHQAGQFAFVRQLQGNREAHPFTIASADSTSLRFFIKNLGDYTAQTAQYFKPGEQVEIEGPYGCFNFEDNTATQVWIGSGIGITPFMAKLDRLSTTAHHQKIWLFYCHRNADESLLNELRQKSAQANIELILWDSSEQGRLTATDIRQQTGDMADSSVWFCGNTSFARQLKADLKAKAFHQELFEMR